VIFRNRIQFLRYHCYLMIIMIFLTNMTNTENDQHRNHDQHRKIMTNTEKSWLLLDNIDIEGTGFCSEISHTRTDQTA
jgi:hypothetical protein